MALPAHTRVWVPNPESGFEEAVLLEDLVPGQACRVKLVQTGADKSVESVETVVPPALAKQIERAIDTDMNKNPDDLSTLPLLSRASLLEAIRLRHAEDKVYTSVGPILISVNPFKQVAGLYSEATKKTYLDAGLVGGSAPQAPHIYQTAARAFEAATRDGRNQSVIFSGESGAGKTEATKIFTQFLVFASCVSSAASSNISQELVKARLTSANPLIEAFGNAKTTRNDNSSRFAGWTEIEFENNAICGAAVTGFNLEKSRVVARGENQRNFHIFYQLCQATERLRKRQYRYLAASAGDENDASQFNQTLNAMKNLNVDAESVLRVVEGILELGNVEFEAFEHAVTGEESSRINLKVSKPALDRVHELLQFDAKELIPALVVRDMSNAKEEIFKPHTKAQAEEARDALAKHLYGRLFDWLMKRVNEATSSKKRSFAATNMEEEDEANSSHAATTPTSRQGVIGLLDTYGFEVFTVNSFEQFCINYCNERIMKAFTDICIKSEFSLYEKEGLLEIAKVEPFRDRTTACLRLLEGTDHGLFTMMDDEIKIPKGSDANLIRKFRDIHGSHVNFVGHVSELKEKNAKNLFGIVHFAGTVLYDVSDFLDKNRDMLPTRLERVATASEGFVADELFSDALFSLSSSPRKSRKKGVVMEKSASARAFQKLSLGWRFRNQLDALMTTISSTQTHFVRCIKPNDLNVGDKFKGVLVLEQLNYGGVLETCKLRKEGYAVRRSREDFLRAYSRFAPGVTDCDELARILQARFGVHIGMGKTTAFLKADDFDRLEKGIVAEECRARIRLQAFARAILEQRKQSERTQFLARVKRAVDALDEQAIDDLLQGADMKRLFAFGGHHIGLIQKAKQVSAQLKDEVALCKELLQACQERELEKLRLAVVKADTLGHDHKGNVGKVLTEARRILDVLLAEEASALRKREDAENEAKNLALFQAKVSLLQVAAKRALFKKHVKQALEALRVAMADGDAKKIDLAVTRLVQLGLERHPLVVDAQRRLARRKNSAANALAKALAQLDEAYKIAQFKAARIQELTAQDVAPLTLAINKARVDGAKDADVAEAVELEQQMLSTVEAKEQKKKRRWWMMCCSGDAVQAVSVKSGVPTTDVDNSAAVVKKPVAAVEIPSQEPGQAAEAHQQ